MRPKQSEATLATQRKQAKVGMAVTLGTLVGTGFMTHMSGGNNTNAARIAHLAAGVSLVGFAYWHWSLYQGGGRKA